MKKIVIAAVALLAVESFSQSKFGIRLSPNLAMNRVEGDLHEKYGTGVRYSVGLFGDFHLTESVAFNTGLFFATKRNGFKLKNGVGRSVYNTQHVQIPLGFKFLTDEVTSNLRLYFLAGTILDIKINEKLVGKDEVGIYNYAKNVDNDPNRKKRAVFQPIDFAINVGAGIEYKVSSNNSLIAGLSYQHGLINMMNPAVKDFDGKSLSSIVSNKTSAFSLDLGLKF